MKLKHPCVQLGTSLPETPNQQLSSIMERTFKKKKKGWSQWHSVTPELRG